jgi:hypothetical protein
MKMVSRKISAFYTGSLIFISTFLFLLFCGILFIHYDPLVSWVILKLKKPELEGLLRHRAFTYKKFRLLQHIALAGFFVLPVFVFIFHKTRSVVLRRIVFIFYTVRDAIFSWIFFFRQHTKKEKILFFLILFSVFVKSCYYIINRDLQYDEMWSYNYFTASPFYFGFFMYNNYPLYELSTHFFHWLPFPEKINIRLPVLITGTLACVILYYYLFRLFKKQFPALMGIILFAFLPPVTTYMVFGRGVIFEIFFAVVALFSLLHWLDSPKRNDQAVLFILANILGNYAMPTHIYCWICLFLFALLSGRAGKSVLPKFMLINGWILAGTLFCFIPVWLGSGFSFLTSILNPTETLHSIWFSLPELYRNLSYYITGFYFGLTGVLMTCILFLFFRKKFARFRNIILFCFILCLFPFLLYAVQRIRIPERALAFLGLAIPLTAAILTDVYGIYFSKKLQYAVLILSGLAAFEITHINLAFNWNRKTDKQVRELSLLFLNKGINTCYDSSSGSYFSYYYPGIEYYYRQAGKSFRLTPGDPGSIRYRPFSPNDSYDCIVRYTDSLKSTAAKDDKMLFRQPEQGFEVFLLK